MGEVRHHFFKLSRGRGIFRPPPLSALLSPAGAGLRCARPIRVRGPRTGRINAAGRNEQFVTGAAINTVQHVGASFERAGSADEVHLLLHLGLSIRIISPRVMGHDSKRTVLEAVVPEAAVRERIAMAHASERPSPAVRPKALLNQAMNYVPVQ